MMRSAVQQPRGGEKGKGSRAGGRKPVMTESRSTNLEKVTAIYGPNPSTNAHFKWRPEPANHLELQELKWDLAEDARQFLPAIIKKYQDLDEKTISRRAHAMILKVVCEENGNAVNQDIDLKGLWNENVSNYQTYTYERVKFTNNFDGSMFVSPKEKSSHPKFQKHGKNGYRLKEPITLRTFLETLTEPGLADGSDAEVDNLEDIYREIETRKRYDYVIDQTSVIDNGSLYELGHLYNPLGLASGCFAGLNSRQLLVGGRGSCSGTHYEQINLASINCVLDLEKISLRSSGSPSEPVAKLWTLPYDDEIYPDKAEFNVKFLNSLRTELGASQFSQKNRNWECPGMLEQKNCHLMPHFALIHGYKVAHAFQHKNEIVITFPHAIHSVMNLRRNMASAMNFIPVDMNFRIRSDLQCKGHGPRKSRTFHSESVEHLMDTPRVLEDRWKAFMKPEAEGGGDGVYSFRKRKLFDINLDRSLTEGERLKVLENCYSSETPLWMRGRPGIKKTVSQQVVLFAKPVAGKPILVQTSPFRVPIQLSRKNLPFQLELDDLFISESAIVQRIDFEAMEEKKATARNMKREAAKEATSVEDLRPPSKRRHVEQPVEEEDEEGELPNDPPTPLIQLSDHEEADEPITPLPLPASSNNEQASDEKHPSRFSTVPKQFIISKERGTQWKLQVTGFRNSCREGCVFEMFSRFEGFLNFSVAREGADIGRPRKRFNHVLVFFDSEQNFDSALYECKSSESAMRHADRKLVVQKLYESQSSCYMEQGPAPQQQVHYNNPTIPWRPPGLHNVVANPFVNPSGISPWLQHPPPVNPIWVLNSDGNPGPTNITINNNYNYYNKSP